MKSFFNRSIVLQNLGYYISATVFTLGIQGNALARSDIWTFDSGDFYCKLETKLTSTKRGELEYFATGFTLIFIDHPGTHSKCSEGIIQKSVQSMITAPFVYRLQPGSHALIQSTSLLNEQVSLQHFNNNCRVVSAYIPNHRTTSLLLEALNANEDIQITTHFEKSSTQVGFINPEGFPAAYKKMTTCIRDLTSQKYYSTDHRH